MSSVLLYACLKAIILDFILAVFKAKSLVASADTGAKDSVCGDVHTDEQVTCARSASAQDLPVQDETAHTHGASVLNIVLVLGHAGTVDRDASAAC
jgi:hypothetical protein